MIFCVENNAAVFFFFVLFFFCRLLTIGFQGVGLETSDLDDTVHCKLFDHENVSNSIHALASKTFWPNKTFMRMKGKQKQKQKKKSPETVS